MENMTSKKAKLNHTGENKQPTVISLFVKFRQHVRADRFSSLTDFRFPFHSGRTIIFIACVFMLRKNICLEIESDIQCNTFYIFL